MRQACDALASGMSVIADRIVPDMTHCLQRHTVWMCPSNKHSPPLHRPASAQRRPAAPQHLTAEAAQKDSNLAQWPSMYNEALEHLEVR